MAMEWLRLLVQIIHYKIVYGKATGQVKTSGFHNKNG